MAKIRIHFPATVDAGGRNGYAKAGALDIYPTWNSLNDNRKCIALIPVKVNGEHLVGALIELPYTAVPHLIEVLRQAMEARLQNGKSA
jgi:hypothetical protein